MTTSACQHLNPLPTRTFAALAGQTRVLRTGDKEFAHLRSAPTSCAMQALIAQCDGSFKQQLDRYKYPNRYPLESGGDVQAFALAQRFEAASWLQTLESRLSQGWLFGPQPSLADMATLPFVRQFAHTDAAWFAAQPWPQLQAWLAGFEESALFKSVMMKHKPWSETV
mgnify:CR=1 FL=1